MRKKTKKVYGIGVNDADYPVMPVVDGVQVVCTYYSTWKSMLLRAFSKEFHKRQPTYADVTICEEWLSFMKFHEWMECEDWENKSLDKDIRIPGNKVYHPDGCCFVTPEINLLLAPRARGVILWDGRYRATICIYGKRKHLGYFPTVNEAEQAYKKAKKAHIKEVAATQTDARIRDGLIRHAELLAA